VLRLQTEYGILGHDYTRVAADGTPLSADDFEPINGLLAARLEAKKARRYGEADALLGMLSGLGVGVDDSSRLWRADGIAFEPTEWTRIAGDGDVDGKSEIGTAGTEAADGTVAVFDEGVAGSDDAKDVSASRADHSTAPRTASRSAEQLRLLTVPQLKSLLKEAGLRVGGKKVELISRLLEASSPAGKASPASNEGSQTPATTAASHVPSFPDEAADRTGLDNEAAESAAGAAVATAARGEGGCGVDVPAVEALIEARGEAKQAMAYEKADEIAAALRSEHSVVLDDKRRTWRVVVEYGGYYRVGPPVDPFTTKQVGDLLEKRSRHQGLKEYAQADALHEELTEMGIILDTRVKTWKRPAARKSGDREERSRSPKYLR